MPKNSKEQNEKDRERVIDCLLRDPVCSVQGIAEKCNLSTQQVYRILRSLEEEGIIFGKPTMIDLKKLGKKRFIIYARRSGKPSDQVTLNTSLYSSEFLEQLKSKKLDIIPEDDYTCSGAFDMVTVFLANNIMDANKYLDLLRHVSDGYFSSFALSEVMFTTKKNMVTTPERDDFVEYVKEIAAFGTDVEDPEELEHRDAGDPDQDIRTNG